MIRNSLWLAFTLGILPGCEDGSQDGAQVGPPTRTQAISAQKKTTVPSKQDPLAALVQTAHGVRIEVLGSVSFDTNSSTCFDLYGNRLGEYEEAAFHWVKSEYSAQVVTRAAIVKATIVEEEVKSALVRIYPDVAAVFPGQISLNRTRRSSVGFFTLRKCNLFPENQLNLAISARSADGKRLDQDANSTIDDMFGDKLVLEGIPIFDSEIRPDEVQLQTTYRRVPREELIEKPKARKIDFPKAHATYSLTFKAPQITAEVLGTVNFSKKEIAFKDLKGNVNPATEKLISQFLHSSPMHAAMLRRRPYFKEPTDTSRFALVNLRYAAGPSSLLLDPYGQATWPTIDRPIRLQAEGQLVLPNKRPPMSKDEVTDHWYLVKLFAKPNSRQGSVFLVFLDSAGTIPISPDAKAEEERRQQMPMRIVEITGIPIN